MRIVRFARSRPTRRRSSRGSRRCSRGRPLRRHRAAVREENISARSPSGSGPRGSSRAASRSTRSRKRHASGRRAFRTGRRRAHAAQVRGDGLSAARVVRDRTITRGTRSPSRRRPLGAARSMFERVYERRDAPLGDDEVVRLGASVSMFARVSKWLLFGIDVFVLQDRTGCARPHGPVRRITCLT